MEKIGSLCRSQFDHIDIEDKWVNVLFHLDPVPLTGFMHMPQVSYRRRLTDKILEELESVLESLVLEGPIYNAWNNALNSKRDVGDRTRGLPGQKSQEITPSEEQFRSALEKAHSRMEALKTSRSNTVLCSAIQRRCAEIIFELSISVPYCPYGGKPGFWIFAEQIG